MLKKLNPLASFLVMLALGCSSCQTTYKFKDPVVVLGTPVRFAESVPTNWPELEDALLAVRLAVEQLYERQAPGILSAEVRVVDGSTEPKITDTKPYLLIGYEKDKVPVILLHLYAWHVVPHFFGRGWNASHEQDQQDVERTMHEHLMSVLGAPGPDKVVVPKLCIMPTND